MSVEQALEEAKVRHHAGHLNDAEALYRQILSSQPNHPDALHLLGVLALQVRKTDVALNLITRALTINPNAANYHYNLGRSLVAAGKNVEAIDAFRQAVQLRPQFPEALFQLGATLHHVNRLDEAIAAYRQAVAQWPNFAEAHNNLGNALKDRGFHELAIVSLRQALMHMPESPIIHMNLGNAQLAAGQVDDAIVSFREALRLRPDDSECYYNLGNALRQQDRYDEAIRAYRRAISLQPGLLAAYNNLALAHQALRQFDQAIGALKQAIKLLPEYSMAHYNLGLLHLLRGEFENGWPEFHWRWKTREFAPLYPPVRVPMWDGTALHGKTILLHAEQGFGDTIQFARYIPLVAKRGGKIILQCHAELLELMRGIDGVQEIHEHGKPIPPIDTHCALMDLPMVMKTTLDTIPGSVPYLRTATTLAEYWRTRLRALGRGMKVGLVWAGRPSHREDRSRSMTLQHLAPLAAAARVTFISLQKGDAAAQTMSPPQGMQLVDWAEDLSDFADTAALIASLDLVIAVDTAVAHLAGALGRPVWLLLPYTPDWRWLLEREDTPWYPTMKLFRQKNPGDWDEPIDQITDALRFLAVTSH
jgi:tetratricopeptide (TPR) repeat protein